MPCRSPRGGRGLKFSGFVIGVLQLGSLSSRRAWIEILCLSALLNALDGRSPRGGRGLKFEGREQLAGVHESLSSRRAWIEI